MTWITSLCNRSLSSRATSAPHGLSSLGRTENSWPRVEKTTCWESGQSSNTKTSKSTNWLVRAINLISSAFHYSRVSPSKNGRTTTNRTSSRSTGAPRMPPVPTCSPSQPIASSSSGTSTQTSPFRSFSTRTSFARPCLSSHHLRTSWHLAVSTRWSESGTSLRGRSSTGNRRQTTSLPCK